jgi:hypothetical protein
MDAGWSRRQIDYRLASGYLLRRHQGVYAVGHIPRTQQSAWFAAVAFAGPDAVLSHRSAAALWGFGSAGCRIEALRPRRGWSGAGPIVHATSYLPAKHRRVVSGIPVTSAARTLADLPAVEPIALLDDRLSAARRLKLLDCAEVRDAIAGRPTAKGAAELLDRVEFLEASAAVTRSELEARFLRLCTDAHLPVPDSNVEMGSIVVDFVWREQRLIVEVDGLRFHDHRFDEDRSRDLQNLVNGYRTARVTYRMMVKSPGRLVESLRLLLGQDPKT